MNSSGQISNAGAGHLICMQCQEKKLVLKYIFPTQGGKYLTIWKIYTCFGMCSNPQSKFKKLQIKMT